MTLSLSLKSPSSTGRGRAGACSRKSLRDPGSCQLVVLLGLQSLPLGSSADGGPLGGPSGPGLGRLYPQAEATLTTGRPGHGDWLCVQEEGALCPGGRSSVCLGCYCSYLLLQQLER